MPTRSSVIRSCLVVLDEPFSGLDPPARVRCGRDWVGRLRAERSYSYPVITLTRFARTSNLHTRFSVTAKLTRMAPDATRELGIASVEVVVVTVVWLARLWARLVLLVSQQTGFPCHLGRYIGFGASVPIVMGGEFRKRPVGTYIGSHGSAFNVVLTSGLVGTGMNGGSGPTMAPANR